jgi:hypothetical protein
MIINRFRIKTMNFKVKRIQNIKLSFSAKKNWTLITFFTLSQKHFISFVNNFEEYIEYFSANILSVNQIIYFSHDWIHIKNIYSVYSENKIS